MARREGRWRDDEERLGRGDGRRGCCAVGMIEGIKWEGRVRRGKGDGGRGRNGRVRKG